MRARHKFLGYRKWRRNGRRLWWRPERRKRPLPGHVIRLEIGAAGLKLRSQLDGRPSEVSDCDVGIYTRARYPSAWNVDSLRRTLALYIISGQKLNPSFSVPAGTSVFQRALLLFPKCRFSRSALDKWEDNFCVHIYPSIVHTECNNPTIPSFLLELDSPLLKFILLNTKPLCIVDLKK